MAGRPSAAGGTDPLLAAVGAGAAAAAVALSIVETAVVLGGHGPVGLTAAGLVHGFAGWWAHPGDPRQAFPGPIRGALPEAPLMYMAVLVVTAVVAGVGMALAGLVGRFGPAALSRDRDRTDRHRRGLADARSLRRALIHRRGIPSAGGLSVGRPVAGGRMIVTGAEASLGSICPPRTGKSASAVAHILDAPGAVLATSSKPELLLATGRGRQETTGQPTLAYDPLGICGWEHTVRWSPLSGCTDPKVAMRRAEALMAGTRMDSVTDGGFWKAAATMLLRCCLHGVALDDGDVRQLRAWVADPDGGDLEDALTASPAAVGWLRDVQLMVRQHGETLDSVALTTAVALDCLALPDVADACSPPPADAFDPVTWITSGGTLHVVAPDAEAASVAPLTAALVDEVIIAGRHLAAQARSGRLDPPLRLVLDELANICPLPKVAQYVTDGGGRGLQIVWYAQARSQLIERFGPHTTATLLGATTVMCYGGGLSDPELLRDLSTLLGTIPVRRRTWSTDRTGATSWTDHQQPEAVMDPSEIFALPPFQVLMVAGGIGGALVRLVPWWERPDARLLRHTRDRALDRTGRTT